MTEILRVLVGSRAHGTHNEDSDYDYRGVFIVDPIEIISPFRSKKTSHWIEGDEDNVLWELSHFCKMCAQGNPSALEVLAATPEQETLVMGTELQALLPHFLSKKCIQSFMGYSKNNEKKFRDNTLGRKYKYAEAHVRTLYQLLHLLETGELKLAWDNPMLKELKDIKRGLCLDVEIMGRIFSLEQHCLEAAKKTKLPEEPNINEIENFLSYVYLR